MKTYEKPIIEIVFIDESDIITSSSEGYIEFWGEQNNE